MEERVHSNWQGETMDEYGDIVINTGMARSYTSKVAKKSMGSSSAESPTGGLGTNDSGDDGLDAFLKDDDDDENETRTNNDDSLLDTSASEFGLGKRASPLQGGDSPIYPGLDSSESFSFEKNRSRGTREKNMGGFASGNTGRRGEVGRSSGFGKHMDPAAKKKLSSSRSGNLLTGRDLGDAAIT